MSDVDVRRELLWHRPHGVEHPYATSPEQRVPVLPEVGQRVRLGVVAAPEVTAVTCEWVAATDDGDRPGDTTSATLVLQPAAPDGADSAALAGGEGHLAEAQATAAASDGGWEVWTGPLAEGVRYRYRFHAATKDTAGPAASTEWFEVVPARWVHDAGTLNIQELRDSDGAHGARDRSGRDLSRETAMLDRLVDGSVEWLVADGAVHRARFALWLEPDEHVVGFGERFDAVDQRGRRLDAVVFEQYKAQGRHGRTYLPMPFAHVISESGKSWGIHVRTSRRTWFDVGASSPDRLVVEVALGTATTRVSEAVGRAGEVARGANELRSVTGEGGTATTRVSEAVGRAGEVARGANELRSVTGEGGTATTRVSGVVGRAGEVARGANELRSVTTGGDATGESVEVAIYHGLPADVLAAFTAEVGRAEELPSWVFRLWASGNEWNAQRIVMDRMDRHRDLDIPVGVVVIEAWSDEQTFAAFGDGLWPDPKGMVDELHERGIKVILWQIPLLKTRHELGDEVPGDAQVIRYGEELVRDGHAVREADGSPYHNRGWWFPQALMPDLSVQRTRDWWTEKRRYLVRDLGVDGFKTDGGEHAWGHDLRYADGRRGDEGNNLYPVHYARAYGDLLRSEGRAPVTFSRAGFTGSQAHGVFWAGDEDSTWEAFRSSVIAGITASACGIVYWGWDIAGFSGDVPDPELYVRAAGVSCLMPIMQYHSEFHHHEPPLRDRTPWNVAERTGDERVVPVFRRLAQLRERLVDYLAEQAAVAAHEHRPLMRGLFFDHPDDPEVWRYPLQFQLGDALLVVPVVEPGVEEVVAYLPAGEWVDAWRGTRYTGPAEITLPAPVDQPPVLCRTERWAEMSEVFRPLAG